MIFSTNTSRYSGAMEADYEGRPAANWLFECLGGPLSGQYVTMQKIPEKRGTVYITEAFVDAEKEVQDGTMIQGEEG